MISHIHTLQRLSFFRIACIIILTINLPVVVIVVPESASNGSFWSSTPRGSLRQIAVDASQWVCYGSIAWVLVCQRCVFAVKMMRSPYRSSDDWFMAPLVVVNSCSCQQWFFPPGQTPLRVHFPEL